MWQSKARAPAPIVSTPVEIHSVAFWCPFTLTCQDHSFLRTTTFALDLLSRRFILLLIFHRLGHFLQEHLPTPILIISHELKLLSLLPCPYFMRRGFCTSHSPLYIGIQCIVGSCVFFEVYELKHIEFLALWIKGADDCFPRSCLRFLHHIENKIHMLKSNLQCSVWGYREVEFIGGA